MITMQEFVAMAVSAPHRSVMLVECYTHIGTWPIRYGVPEFLYEYLSKSPFAAVVYPDGSAQLLSRDEDECLLFTTLWELEK